MAKKKTDIIEEEPKELSIRDKALKLIELDKLYKSTEKEIETLKSELLKSNVSEYFTDISMKVIVTEGSNKSEIDMIGLFKDMVKRKDEFLSVISTSEKALKTLSDGEILIAKHKKIVGKGNSTVKVSAMNKEEIKKMLAEE